VYETTPVAVLVEAPTTLVEEPVTDPTPVPETVVLAELVELYPPTGTLVEVGATLEVELEVEFEGQLLLRFNNVSSSAILPSAPRINENEIADSLMNLSLLNP